MEVWKNSCCILLEACYVSTMKTQFSDIDIADPKKLARAKVELTRLLRIVDFALLEYGRASSSGPQAELPMEGILLQSETRRTNGHEPRETEKLVLDVIERLENRFTTSDVILAFGNEGKEKRPQIKLALKRAVENGTIRVVKLGQGRRPSQYEKAQETPG
jgi:hypothetical protein